MRGQDSTFLNGKRYQFCCHLGHERMGILFYLFIYGDEGYSLCVWTNLVQLRIWFLGRMVLENGSGDGGGFYFSGDELQELIMRAGFKGHGLDRWVCIYMQELIMHISSYVCLI